MEIIKNLDLPNRRGRVPSRCKNCNILITRRSGYGAIFCSTKCQHDYQFNLKYIKWLNGEISWKTTPGLKKAVIRHFGYFCSQCNITEWNSKAYSFRFRT